MFAPFRHRTSILTLATALYLGGSMAPVAWADTALPSNRASNLAVETAASALGETPNHLTADTPATARHLLKDLSASPGAARAAGLTRWTETRITRWQSALAEGDAARARDREREVQAALESLRGLQGSMDLGLNQLTVLFNTEGAVDLKDPAANAVLGALAALLETQGTRVQITGYAVPGEVKSGGDTLPRGADLALERARYVAWRLHDLGVPANRMSLSGLVDPAMAMMPIPGDPLPDPLGHRVEILVEDPLIAERSPHTMEGDTLVAEVPGQ